MTQVGHADLPVPPVARPSSSAMWVVAGDVLLCGVNRVAMVAGAGACA